MTSFNKARKGKKKIVLKRIKQEEDANVHFWFESGDGQFVASVVGQEGDVQARLSTPKGRQNFGMVGAIPEDRKRDVKGTMTSIKRMFEKMGFDVELNE